MNPVNPVKQLRQTANVTQAELAARAGTSQPTVAAYEGGSKSPTLRTLHRLAHAVGRDMFISFVPALTREDRRSLCLHSAIADVLQCRPGPTLEHARRNVRRMKQQHAGAHTLLVEWQSVLQLPVERIVDVLVDPRPYARELRHVTPFAGVLTARQRARVYRRFADQEAAR